MSILVQNETQYTLKIKDYYPRHSTGKPGIYGALDYKIRAGGRKTIRASVFTDKLIEHLESQEIHVMRGEQKLLDLLHVDFEKNKGKKLLLQMQGDDGLRHVFAPRRGGMRSDFQLDRLLEYKAE